MPTPPDPEPGSPGGPDSPLLPISPLSPGYPGSPCKNNQRILKYDIVNCKRKSVMVLTLITIN